VAPSAELSWHDRKTARPVPKRGDGPTCDNRPDRPSLRSGTAVPPLNQLREKGMAMTIVEAARAITGGVDTHLDVHVAAALDPLGGVLGTESFPTTPAGYKALLSWWRSFGEVTKVGVEGTGSYGAGLARFLRRSGIEVIDVDRPNRQSRRQQGKSDPLDAIEAARAALSGRAQGCAKTRDGAVEAIRVLVVAKRSAREARIKALMQMRHLGITAPEQVRCRLKGLHVSDLVREGTTLGSGRSADPVIRATRASLSSLAHRIEVLEAEIAALDELLVPLVAAHAPELLALYGVGPDTAAALLIAAGDNPERITSEAAWAHLCGVSPIQASSGKVTRHRLDRGGNRQANHALWRIVMVRLSHDPETRAYMQRRVKEGRSKPEVIRILKRYVAREVYRHLPRA
jgi:transposase